MRSMFTAGVAATAMAVAANAQEACFDVCLGTALSFQDPHLIPFKGNAFHLPKSVTEVTMYELGEFKVWAPQTHVEQGYNFFYEIHFGNEVVKASELCTQPGDSTTLTHYFGEKQAGSDYAEAYIWCQMLEGQSEIPLFLGIYFTKVDSRTDNKDFLEIEAGLGATGKFFGANQQGSDRRALRGDQSGAALDAGTPVSKFVPPAPPHEAPHCFILCEEERPCEGQGDPHMTTFFNDKYSLKNAETKTYTAYKMPKNHNDAEFEVTVDTAHNGRTTAIHFGTQQTIDAATDCKKQGQQFEMDKTFPYGDILRVHAHCTKGSNNKHTKTTPFFLNWRVMKFDRSSSASTSFRELEKKEQTSGLCIEEPASN